MSQILDLVPIWTLILGMAVFFYVLLDGFDLGVGMLFGLAPDTSSRNYRRAARRMPKRPPPPSNRPQSMETTPAEVAGTQSAITAMFEAHWSLYTRRNEMSLWSGRRFDSAGLNSRAPRAFSPRPSHQSGGISVGPKSCP